MLSSPDDRYQGITRISDDSTAKRYITWQSGVPNSKFIVIVDAGGTITTRIITITDTTINSGDYYLFYDRSPSLAAGELYMLQQNGEGDIYRVSGYEAGESISFTQIDTGATDYGQSGNINPRGIGSKGPYDAYLIDGTSLNVYHFNWGGDPTHGFRYARAKHN